MRLLHTSDWHLGRTLHGFSLREAQTAAVMAIVDTAVERDVDGVVIAGDVFDRAVPPIEALRLLNAALARLDAAGITTIITAGNHDSGDRLATYAGLLRQGVHIIGSPAEAGTGIALTDDFGPVVVYPLPYLEPDFARVDLANGDDPLDRSHEAVVGAALSRIAADVARRGNPRSVVVAHAFVVEGTTTPDEVASTSERDLSVGGVQVVPASLFEGHGVDYVALGHLHRPRQVRAAGPTLQYSGSLLRYSLSEANDDKSVVIVDLGAPGTAPVVELVPVLQERGMTRLSGTIDALLSESHAEHRQDFVELVVTDSRYPERMHARLDAVFPFALVKVHQPHDASGATDVRRGDARGRDPLEVMTEFVRKVTGQEPTPGEQTALQDAYDSARAGGT